MATHDIGIKEFHDLMKAMRKGLPDLPPGITALTILGKTYTRPELAAQIALYEGKYAKAEDLAVQARTAAEERDAEAPEARAFVAAAKGAIKTALGRKSANLTVVGITPDKTPAPPTVEEIQVRVAKAKATRAARHTMGKKQKAKIKGQVPPPAPPSPPAPPPPSPGNADEPGG
jgi:hypothetical protein